MSVKVKGISTAKGFHALSGVEKIVGTVSGNEIKFRNAGGGLKEGIYVFVGVFRSPSGQTCVDTGVIAIPDRYANCYGVINGSSKNSIVYSKKVDTSSDTNNGTLKCTLQDEQGGTITVTSGTLYRIFDTDITA